MTSRFTATPARAPDAGPPGHVTGRHSQKAPLGITHGATGERGETVDNLHEQLVSLHFISAKIVNLHHLAEIHERTHTFART
jgi:hypothetical protein